MKYWVFLKNIIGWGFLILGCYVAIVGSKLLSDKAEEELKKKIRPKIKDFLAEA